MSRALLLAGAAGVLLGAGGLRLVELRRGPDPDAREALAHRLDAQEAKLDFLLERFSSPGAAPAGTVDLDRLGREMASAVRAAAAKPAERTGDTATAVGEGAPAGARTDEQRESSERAQAVMRAAVAAGRLTEKDRDDLRGLFGALAPADQGDLLRQYSLAVNQDKLRLDPAGPF